MRSACFCHTANQMSHATESINHFAGAYLDRASRLRQDPAWLAAALADAGSLFVPVHRDRSLVASLEVPRARFLQRAQLAELGCAPDADNAIFLGLYQDRAVFALELGFDEGGETSGPDLARLAGEFVDLWQVGRRLDAVEAGILAYAKAMIGWRNRHRYCSLTGEPLEIASGGHVLATPSGQKLFPRVDPAIIVLVTDGERCLLGRQAQWPAQRFSTIAGFVEPGESLEDAVAREVAEETNIKVANVRYHSSQPWPFPSSLMLGFHAEARSTDIVLNDQELAEARWCVREDILEHRVRVPPPLSISHQLIATWFDRWDGPRLAEVLGTNPRW